eukprot:GDKJ01019928.1.p1 GENE.GDKJ01019928.1~~GDKJ01019928.1.p1  ORF type:complete len:359 (-),score=59.47 GDKJ01019928.1:61-1137(-)
MSNLPQISPRQPRNISNTSPLPSAREARKASDISFLRDKQTTLTSKLSETQIPEVHHVTERSFLPTEGSKYNPKDGMWHTLIFPSNKPSSRMDAVLLDRWITHALEQYTVRLGTKADLSMAVEELVPILSKGLNELVRQVSHHCVERGVVLEKVWRTYVELFDRVLKELKAELNQNHERTARTQEELERVSHELEETRQKHPQQMQRLITTLENKFAQRQSELEEQTSFLEAENRALAQRLREMQGEVDCFLPSFRSYKSCPIKAVLAATAPRTVGNPGDSSTGVGYSGTSAEGALLEDIKRLVGALPSAARKRLGVALAPSLGLQAKAEKRSVSSPKNVNVLSTLGDESPSTVNPSI